MDQLEKARQVINEVDKELAELFEKRMKAVQSVASYKIEHQLPILDYDREQKVITNNLKHIQEEQLKPHFETILKSLMQVSRDYQKHMMGRRTIAYPGVEGAFSHIASKQLFPEDTLTRVNTFEEVFQKVVNGEAEFGVVPFENSFTGEVGEVLDHLLQYDLYILDVYDLKIQQNLLGLKNAELSDIKQVYSHPQAISQCREYLKMVDWEIIPYTNTALAAQYVSQTQDKTKAAIASNETASLYDLQVLKADINTSNENTTRFIIIGKQMKLDGNRIPLLFTLHHQTGALAKVMQMIAEHGFNMESIKSRPLHNQPWQYYFYVELDGDADDDKTTALLDALSKQCESLKLLGAFHSRKGS